MGQHACALGNRSINSLGVMHRFAQSPWLLGLRFTHYSNADIKRPNPGQDYLQLRLGYTL